jgi:alkylhydroperoxidase/carboxymuconolactone decarboxylase family protein YurZ
VVDPADPRPTSAVEVIRGLCPELADAFVGARSIIERLGPIDTRHRELIMVAGFTAARIEPGFRVHAKRALEAGATADELRQAVALMLFSTQGIAPIAEALRWAEDVIAAHPDHR